MKRFLLVISVLISSISAFAININSVAEVLEKDGYEYNSSNNTYLKRTNDYISLYKLVASETDNSSLFAIMQVFEYSEQYREENKPSVMDISPTIYLPEFFDYFEVSEIKTDYKPEIMEHGVKILYLSK